MSSWKSAHRWHGGSAGCDGGTPHAAMGNSKTLGRGHMPQGNILHFSCDDIHRTEVLRNAGYTVLECNALPEYARILRDGAALDLICISEATKAEEGTLALARTYSPAPVVLFRSSYKTYVQANWSLEIQPLTEPRHWLEAVEKLIARSQLRLPGSE